MGKLTSGRLGHELLHLWHIIAQQESLKTEEVQGYFVPDLANILRFLAIINKFLMIFHGIWSILAILLHYLKKSVGILVLVRYCTSVVYTYILPSPNLDRKDCFKLRVVSRYSVKVWATPYKTDTKEKVLHPNGHVQRKLLQISR